MAEQRTDQRRRCSTAVTRANTAAWRRRFLRALTRSGNVTVACHAAHVSRNTAYRHRKVHQEFAQAWAEAMETANDLLVYELWRRAKDGVERPVFFRGQQVGTVTRYSDTLGMFLLKAFRPERYRERALLHESPSQPFDAAGGISLADLLGEVAAPQQASSVTDHR